MSKIDLQNAKKKEEENEVEELVFMGSYIDLNQITIHSFIVRKKLCI